MKKEGLGSIKDFLYIPEDIYTSSQPTEEQIPILFENKFEIVINLSAKRSPGSLVNEQQLVMDNCMAYVHIPVEWENPTSGDYSKFCYFFSTYRTFKTYVHCSLNMRVSSFIFLYRTLVEKHDPSNCLKDLLAIWKPNIIWQLFIDQMLVEHSGEENSTRWNVDWSTCSIRSQPIRGCLTESFPPAAPTL